LFLYRCQLEFLVRDHDMRGHSFGGYRAPGAAFIAYGLRCEWVAPSLLSRASADGAALAEETIRVTPSLSPSVARIRFRVWTLPSLRPCSMSCMVRKPTPESVAISAVVRRIVFLRWRTDSASDHSGCARTSSTASLRSCSWSASGRVLYRLSMAVQVRAVSSLTRASIPGRTYAYTSGSRRYASATSATVCKRGTIALRPATSAAR
jgi:hypothetical protein